MPLPQRARDRIRNLVGRAAVKLQKTVHYDDPQVIHQYRVYEGIIACRQRTINEKEHLLNEKEHIINEKDSVISHKNDVISAREATIKSYGEYTDTVFEAGKRGKDFVEYKENHITFTDEDVKPVACYLTQFHAIPENDEWWGKGFTEWTNVTKSMPLFRGHHQPQLPLETFYDLSSIEVMKRQVELAKNYGIYGFMFHYYWFSGKRLLEKPLENLIKTKDGLDFPFCINWANHSWTRVWDASEDDVLMEQVHSEEDDLACIADISRYLTDDRYIKINGKPIISIFNPTHLPNPNKTISIWRDYCRRQGIGEIHIVGMDNHVWDPLIYSFDGGIAQSPHDIGMHKIGAGFGEELIKTRTSVNGKTICHISDMEKYISEKMYLRDGRDKLYRGIIPSFDNSARRSNGVSIKEVKPEFYREWLYDILQSAKKTHESGNRFIFINAWNEWAEGAHLEPDRRYGYAYLQATADAVLAARRGET